MNTGPAKITVIANQKGGVAKTTLALNLGDSLCQIKNQKVLMIDLDPQGNLSEQLCKAEVTEGTKTMADVINKNVSISLRDIIQETKTPNLFIAPSDLKLSSQEIIMSSYLGRESTLKTAITKEILYSFDHIIIDTSPSLGILTINAFCAGDFLLIPTCCEHFSAIGLKLLFETLEATQQAMSARIFFIGAVFTQYQGDLKVTQYEEDRLKILGDKIFKNKIRKNTKISQAQAVKETILTFDNTCRGSKDHIAVMNEFIEKINKYEYERMKAIINKTATSQEYLHV